MSGMSYLPCIVWSLILDKLSTHAVMRNPSPPPFLPFSSLHPSLLPVVPMSDSQPAIATILSFPHL